MEIRLDAVRKGLGVVPYDALDRRLVARHTGRTQEVVEERTSIGRQSSPRFDVERMRNITCPRTRQSLPGTSANEFTPEDGRRRKPCRA